MSDPLPDPLVESPTVDAHLRAKLGIAEHELNTLLMLAAARGIRITIETVDRTVDKALAGRGEAAGYTAILLQGLDE